MVAFNKFQNFIERLGKGEMNLHTDTIKIYLSNATPSASGDDVKADLAEISAGNGYTAGGADAQNTYTETSGTATLNAVDVTFTASGGTIGPFRYAVAYNDTHANDALIGWWDYGSSITLNNTETFTVNFTTDAIATFA